MKGALPFWTLISGPVACVWLLVVLAAGTACTGSNGGGEEDRILARVHNKTLYLSELEGMVPDDAPIEDSMRIVENYVNRWAREALLLYEAERNLPKDLNLDKLVRDYRASLIKANYEKILVERLLDSTITREELQTFYNQNKEQYQLQTPIIQCNFLKVAKPMPDEEDLRIWWGDPQGEYFDRLVAYANQHALAHHLEDSTWHKVADIAVLMPSGMLDPQNLSAPREMMREDDEYAYFFRLLDVKRQGELAPLSFIEEQARRTILHKRKIKLLEDKKEDLYAVELRRNNINLYIE